MPARVVHGCGGCTGSVIDSRRSNSKENGVEANRVRASADRGLCRPLRVWRWNGRSGSAAGCPDGARGESDRRSTPEALRLAIHRPGGDGRADRRRRRRRERSVDLLRRATQPAASGRPRTTARPSRRCSTSTRCRPSATSPSPRPTRNIVYVGTGEPNNRQSSSFGGGVFKSTDGGKTFTFVGLKETQTIAKIAIHPKDPEHGLRRGAGHLFGPNAERGIYKTTDGGKTWTLVKFIDNDTGFIDMVMHPIESERHLGGVVPAAPPAVGVQRRRSGQRHLATRRCRQDLDEGLRQRPAGQSRSSAASVWTSAGRSRTSSSRRSKSAERRHGRGRQRGRQPGPARPGQAAEVGGGGTRRRPPEAAPDPNRRAASGDPKTAARPGGS